MAEQYNMPTEDYSNSLRIARLRNKAVVAGLNKVARALDNQTQFNYKLGGLTIKTKNSSGIVIDSCCPSQCIYLQVIDGMDEYSTPTYIFDGGDISSEQICFVNGGLI